MLETQWWGGPIRTGIGTPWLEQNQSSHSERGKRSSLVRHWIWLSKTNDFQNKEGFFSFFQRFLFSSRVTSNRPSGPRDCWGRRTGKPENQAVTGGFVNWEIKLTVCIFTSEWQHVIYFLIVLIQVTTVITTVWVDHKGRELWGQFQRGPTVVVNGLPRNLITKNSPTTVSSVSMCTWSHTSLFLGSPHFFTGNSGKTYDLCHISFGQIPILGVSLIRFQFLV